MGELFDGMFPNLDYDLLNQSLSPSNFNKSLQNQPQPDNGGPFSKFKDGVDVGGDPGQVADVEVSEKDIPQGGTKEWSNLSKAERIKTVKDNASGMPIVSTIDVALLRKTAEGMIKRGMYKESAKVFRVAENFIKELFLQKSTIDSKEEENASVTVNYTEDETTPTETMTFHKEFSSIDEAQDFFDTFDIEDLQEVHDSMDKFGFKREAINIRRFFRKALVI